MSSKQLEWVKIKTSRASGGKVKVTAYVSTGAGQDADELGEVDFVQSLGIHAVPFDENADGACEGLAIRGIGGRKAVVFAAQDSRFSSLARSTKPGDVVLHSIGPEKAAQVRLSESKRQVSLATRGSNGKDIAMVLDGKNDKIGMNGFGCSIQMSSKGLVLAGGGVSIVMQGGKIYMNGEMAWPGMIPGTALMAGPFTGTTNTNSAPIFLKPVFGVSK